MSSSLGPIPMNSPGSHSPCRFLAASSQPQRRETFDFADLAPGLRRVPVRAADADPDGPQRDRIGRTNDLGHEPDATCTVGQMQLLAERGRREGDQAVKEEDGG